MYGNTSLGAVQVFVSLVQKKHIVRERMSGNTSRGALQVFVILGQKISK